MKNINFRYILILLMIVGGVSCSKMNDLHQGWLDKGEAVYGARPDSVKAFAGYNRVVLEIYYSAQRIKEAVISWNNGVDSLIVPIAEGTTKLVHELPLEEGSYVINVVTKDIYNNRSLTVEARGQSFGDTFMSTKTHRYLNTPSYVNGSTVQLKFGYADDSELCSEVMYTDLESKTQTFIVMADEKIVDIPNIKISKPIMYRSLFIPSPSAIDTLKTDYKEVELPEYIVQLKKPKMKGMFLPTDAPEGVGNGIGVDNQHMSSMFDDALPDWFGYQPKFTESAGYPVWFTIDLGVSAKLKYFRVWCQQPYAWCYYQGAHAKEMEVWGANDEVAIADGSWGAWTKLMDCNSYRPSGAPVREGEIWDVPQQDINFQLAGEKYDFPVEAVRYRYLRFKIKDVWGATKTAPIINELTFWGDDSES